MINAIPNPKKTLTIDFPLEKVNTGIERIHKISNKFRFVKNNPTFNQTTLEVSELLSLGALVDINLSAINENRTEITIEVRRKVGTFNQAHEVTSANQYIQNLIDLISQGMNMSEDEINKLVEEQNQKATEKNKKKKKGRMIFWGIVLLILILLNLLAYL